MLRVTLYPYHWLTAGLDGDIRDSSPLRVSGSSHFTRSNANTFGTSLPALLMNVAVALVLSWATAAVATSAMSAVQASSGLIM